MTSDPLSTNLTFACSFLPSIALVCRRIGINRQQFNKYLSGRVRPSRHNMRKICEFFGVTEGELRETGADLVLATTSDLLGVLMPAADTVDESADPAAAPAQDAAAEPEPGA